jgi:hypothetical protein
MKNENRHVILVVNNFSGHGIKYTTSHVRIEFSEPNLTSYVQPLDAGIIQCFKAQYRRGFCEQALDLDEAGEENIYKINLLEGMLLAKHAWNEVTRETIEHCWTHTRIQPQ